MIPKLLESVTRDDIQRLIENSVPESRTMEYKRVPPGTSDSDKVKFLRAVSGMANTDGGDVIYGIEAEDGVPVAAPGIPVGDIDSLKLRFEGMVQDSIEPRIPGVAMHSVPMDDNTSVLVVRSRRSWLLPHRVVVGNHGHFYARNSASTYQMDVSQIREAFLFSDQHADRVRAFIVDRLLKVEQGRSPAPLVDGAKMVLHVIPLSSIFRGSSQQLSVPKVERTNFPLFENGSTSQKPNLDGFVVFDSRDANCETYTQVFRTGAVEAVMAFERDRSGDDGLKGGYVELSILRTLEEIVKQIAHRDIPVPYVVNLSFVGVQGYRLLTNQFMSHRTPTRYREPMLILPDAMIESVESFRSWEVMRPVFDTLWNAFGFDGSPHYDEQGNWNRS